MDARRFRLTLAALTLLGLAARIAYALIADVPRGFGDDVWFHTVANNLVHGRGFSDPFNSLAPHGTIGFGANGAPLPTAFHPPLFPWLLAIPSAVGLDSYTAHQIVGCVLGAAAVPLIGLVARRLAGNVAGVAAAAIAAVFVPLVANDALLLSESLYGALIALVLLLALRLRERPSARRAAELGVAIALAALTRSEALLLLPFLAVPIVWRAPEGRGRAIGVTFAAVLLVCLPWCVRNSLQFDQPTGITTGDGSVIAGANLHSTYYGPNIGGWDFQGLYQTPAGRSLDPNEAVQSDRWRSEGLKFAREHASRLPAVVVARVARTWDLFPLSPAERVREAGEQAKHITKLEWPGMVMLLAVWILAVVGALWLRRIGQPFWPLLVPVALVTFVSIAGHGDVRYRHGADVALVVLAGLGVAGMKGRPWPRPSP
jgi:4-amino-4-deoxy-L-arabinose transferase-like glycosyltransferase